ncbi:Protein phosphatase 1, regulatory subunit [Phytophthora cinnamomi]|uniref:Protein phosphatase 1, regulatory subunit n=1 Tax=Phytophthora cinnamomi TaxID=4785 RepID=UPI003559A408|nr:Protein phosphatase 1, regulatory subunit [Phytophthora cinnamomi]
MEEDLSTSGGVLPQQGDCEADTQQCEADELANAESSLPGPLTREHVTKRLSILGRNPFTQAHIYTTATLTGLHLTDIEAIHEFSHIQHVICNQNQLRSLAPLQHIRLLLTLDAAENHLTEVLDFEVPKCCPGNAWVDGARWIGSLLRKATLDKNQIASMPRHELATTHPFLLELRLAHNAIEEISGVSQLRFLRLLDLSHNRLASMRGLVAGGEEAPRGLQALETLLLNHNQLTAIDPGVALLPRLTHLDVAHNQLQTLSSLGDCIRLQRLELAHNRVADINELNCLAGLRYLGHLSLDGCPLVEAQVSRVFYRARVLRRLLQLQKLDDEQVTSKEKVKALVMHGSDLEARRRVAAKHLPGHEFADFLPPLDFEDDEQLELPLRRTPSSVAVDDATPNQASER